MIHTGLCQLFPERYCVCVLQAVAAKLDLPEDLIGYFSLFLIRESVDGGITCESAERSLLSFLAIIVFFLFCFFFQTESLASFKTSRFYLDNKLLSNRPPSQANQSLWVL